MQITMLSSVWLPELLTAAAAMLQQLPLLTAKDSFLLLLLIGSLGIEVNK
jgi:hypothetical protein